MAACDTAHLGHNKLCNKVDFQLLPQLFDRLICQGIKPDMNSCKLQILNGGILWKICEPTNNAPEANQLASTDFNH